MVKLLPNQFKSLRKVHKGLIRRYEGPFSIIEKVGKAAYRLKLPPRLKIHNVFHVSMLKPFYEDKEDPSRGESSRAPTGMISEFDRKIKEILAERKIRRRGVPTYNEYLIAWEGLPESEASWEKEDTLWQFQDEIRRFQESATGTLRNREKQAPERRHKKVQASSKQPHPSTSTRLPALTPHPTLGEKPTFRQTLPPSKKQSKDISYPREQATPNDAHTKCKHHPSKPIQANQLDIPLSLPTRRRGPAFRLKQHPSSKKQSQVISHPQEQASPNNAHNKVQASSKQARPSTSTRHPALTPTRRWGTDIPTKPSIKQEAITRPSRILKNKQAQTTPTTKCKHHPSKPIQAHQLDIPHSHYPPDVKARIRPTLPTTTKQSQVISYCQEQAAGRRHNKCKHI
ncbi:hypothetical protein CSA_017400 [Cucumis sativus]|uniref:Uncharacterized protein n=1 Tax=Cucumis sativus TaxID=3659 RepID=A0ACB6HCD6_CUCSA|nr:hypothetical protein CSA_017400 [Cucumis sativus]